MKSGILVCVYKLRLNFSYLGKYKEIGSLYFTTSSVFFGFKTFTLNCNIAISRNFSDKIKLSCSNVFVCLPQGSISQQTQQQLK